MHDGSSFFSFFSFFFLGIFLSPPVEAEEVERYLASFFLMVSPFPVLPLDKQSMVGSGLVSLSSLPCNYWFFSPFIEATRRYLERGRKRQSSRNIALLFFFFLGCFFFSP